VWQFEQQLQAASAEVSAERHSQQSRATAAALLARRQALAAAKAADERQLGTLSEAAARISSQFSVPLSSLIPEPADLAGVSAAFAWHPPLLAEVEEELTLRGGVESRALSWKGKHAIALSAHAAAMYRKLPRPGGSFLHISCGCGFLSCCRSCF
jgi:hypothetical protein